MKTHLIIGASSGVGLALANQLLKNGDSVINISRSLAELENPNLKQFSNDVSIDLPELSGPLDSLIYCPGSINLKPFRSLQPSDFLNDFNINVLYAIKCLQAYLPNLKMAEGTASVVFFSTVAVQMGMPFHASIAVAKGALEGLTKSLAAELAPKIRVNAIAPSLTNTPLAEKLLNTEEKMKASADRHPLKIVGQSQQIAEAACLLLYNNFITGTILQIDGGIGNIK